MASYSICLLPVFVIVIVIIGPAFSMMTPVMIRDLLTMGEPPMTPFAEGQDISRECKADLAKLVRERPIGKIALALDATGKPEAGFLVGHWAWLGHFDECMAIEDFRYCLSYVSLQLPVTQFGVPLQWGLCTPESCSDTDVRNSLDFFFDLLSAPFNNSEVSATGVICSDDPPAPFTPGFWGTLSLILFFAVLMIAGALQDEIRIWNSTEGIHGITTSPKPPQDASVPHNGVKKAAEVSVKVEEVTTNLDIAIQADLGEDNEGFKMEIDSNHDVGKDGSQSNDIENEKALEEKTTEITMDKEGENVFGGVTGVIIRIWNEVARCFAFNRNLESLMDTRTTSATIRCLDGIRVLSMTWIILGHVPAFLMENRFYANAPFALEMLRHFGFQVVVNAYFAVDSFFFLSGLLVTYMTLKRMVKTKGRIPWFWFYFQRYCRLTPAMAVSMLIWIYLRPLLGNGPKWPNQVMNHRCGDDWWANFLYINNFVGGMCISWVWYLANDFQFFVISPIFIVLLYRKPKIGFGALSVTCLASFITTAVLMVVNEFSARLNGMLDPNTSGAEFQSIVYVKPYCRIPPYLVGIAVGYLLHIYRDKRMTMHPMLALLGWIAATALGMTCVYGFYPSYHGNELTDADSAAYVALSKFAWAVSLAWVVIACHHGYGGWINSLLSWKFWMPLSRLSYSNYLLHPIILTIITFNFRSTYFYSNSMFVFGVAGIIILSYGSALFLWISVEFPFSNLVKSLMESSQKK